MLDIGFRYDNNSLYEHAHILYVGDIDERNSR